MTTVVVPFAGSNGKTRLDAPRSTRRELSLAMLADVLAATAVLGRTLVVTADVDGGAVADEAGAEAVADPGGGQGVAVAAALELAADEQVLVVNADLPCVVPVDLRALLAAIPAHGLALVEALDGTTNALGLSAPEVFAPLYGPDSASRFRALTVETVAVVLPNLAEDVDTLEDLERLQLRCGPRTQAALAALSAGTAQ
jgi:2-phospho-L-lactate guanylyltransferase